MKFLIDNPLSPKLAHFLRNAGHDAIHVRDLDLGAAADLDIIERAAADSRVIVTADGDFARILALLRLHLPSVIFVREDGPHRATKLAEFLLAHLRLMKDALCEGALVVVHHQRIRVRDLPIIPE